MPVPILVAAATSAGIAAAGAIWYWWSQGQVKSPGQSFSNRSSGSSANAPRRSRSNARPPEPNALGPRRRRPRLIKEAIRRAPPTAVSTRPSARHLREGAANADAIAETRRRSLGAGGLYAMPASTSSEALRDAGEVTLPDGSWEFSMEASDWDPDDWEAYAAEAEPLDRE